MMAAGDDPHRPSGRGGKPPRPAATRALLALLALLLAAGCGERRGAGPPSVVLISIDTLRSDRLPAYGYAAGETPAIDALRADSILFERAYSPMPLTLPAHATLLTGLDPPTHGVRLNMGYRLSEEVNPFLPALLTGAGYETGAAVSSFVLRADTGIGRGFTFFEDSIELDGDAGERTQRLGPETLAAALPWLAARPAADAPFFFFFHLYEPHSPWEPPAPFAARHASPYDGEVAAADKVVGELIAELRRLGLYDEALVVLTSDHGEGLGDHGEQEHGVFLYRESLQVPLLVKLPGARRSGSTVAEPVHLIDVVPTVLEVAGLPPSEGLPGRSLLAPPGGDSRALYAETSYTRVYFGWSELFSLIRGRFHYIHSPDPELYDLVADPAERDNLIDSRREVTARYRAEMRELEPSIAPPGDVDHETRLKLASLGYVGMAASGLEGELPAPRSQAHLLAEIGRALSLARSDRHAEAAAAYRGVLDENPNILLAWPGLARSLTRAGRLGEALGAYDEAVRRSQAAPAVAAEAARLALRLRRLDDAARYAELAARVVPAEGHLLAAQAALLQGDLETARRAVDAASSADPDSIGALMTLAQIEAAGNRLPAALAALERASELASAAQPPNGLFLFQGNLLARAGRAAEAEAALEREIAAFPGDGRAYARLAALYVENDRRGDAVAILRQLAAADGSDRGYAAAINTLLGLELRDAARELLAEARRAYPGSELLARFGRG